MKEQGFGLAVIQLLRAVVASTRLQLHSRPLPLPLGLVLPQLAGIVSQTTPLYRLVAPPVLPLVL